MHPDHWLAYCAAINVLTDSLESRALVRTFESGICSTFELEEPFPYQGVTVGGPSSRHQTRRVYTIQKLYWNLRTDKQ